MRWFLGLNYDALHFAAYAQMIQAAVLSRPPAADLQPHLLFDGPECELTRWFRAQGGEVIFRESYLKPALLAASANPETPHAAKQGNGVFLRAEIPDVMRERGWADEVVLYTDTDVMFTPQFRAADLPAMTHAIAAAPESNRADREIFNSGFMLFHLPRWRALHERFKAFLLEDLPNSIREDWDQYSFRKFFGFDYQSLDPTWNWKPYWGRNPAARVLHFHGPKPFLRDLIRRGHAHPLQVQLATEYFYEACGEFDRLLAAAGLNHAAAPAPASSGHPPHTHLDEPGAEQPVDPLCFLVRGWIWRGDEQDQVAAIQAWAGDVLLGETTARILRRDVNGALDLPPVTRTGFEFFAHHPRAARPFELCLHARMQDGTRSPVLASRVVTPIARDYRQNDFGVLLDQRTTAVHRRPSIYNEGPSINGGSGEVLELIRRYAGEPPRKFIDVGCGLGFYGGHLLALGYDWLGVEVDAADCAELARLGRPHRQVDGRSLPFPDGAFDTALCIEVLEHIDEPHGFLREVRRVAPKQLIVSVPNCELLGYLHDHLAAPWHMLEPDHKNFFTRWSLGGLLREHYAHVEVRFHTPYPLRTPDGTALHYNLFAVATNEA